MLEALNHLLFSYDNTNIVQLMGKFPENPSLDEKRANARRRMAESGRKGMLQGGEYDRRSNKTLNREVVPA